MKDKDEKRDPFDGEYIGNIWGWRFSILGLLLLLMMTGLMAYRHYSLGVPFGGEPTAPVEAPLDSLSQTDSIR